MGDAVDNIPGIAGVGEKTAAKLLAEYGTLENALANAENIKAPLGRRLKRKGVSHPFQKLATIITTVPVEFHEEDFKLKDWDKEKLKEVFAELEFKTLGKDCSERIFPLPHHKKGELIKKCPRECRSICLEMSLRLRLRRHRQ